MQGLSKDVISGRNLTVSLNEQLYDLRLKPDLQSTALDTRIARRNFLKYAAALVAGSAITLATVSESRAEQTLPERHLIDIPYYKQESQYWCGPACTQMLLDYLSVQPLPTQKEIAQEQGRDYVKGTYPDAMMKSFQSRNYAQIYSDNNLTIDKLKKLISAEIPVNILGGFYTGWHWVVAHGFDETKKEMIVHNPAVFNSLGPNRHYDYDSFDKFWINNTVFPGQRIGAVVPYKGQTYIPVP